MTEVEYGRYDEAYRAIHSALLDLTAPPPGRKLTKVAFTWNADGSLATLRGYEGGEAIFTLAFTWDVNGLLKEVART